jgi:capsular exopolysaccharide synthesis family protein
LAQQGRRVLVIDADLSKKGLSTALELCSRPGLNNILRFTGRFEVSNFITKASDVDILPVGTLALEPSELLSSEVGRALMEELRSSYDCILVDTAPLCFPSDALGCADFVDGALLVCRAGLSTGEDFQQAVSVLDRVSIPVMGTVLNGVDAGHSDDRHLRSASVPEKRRKMPESLPSFAINPDSRRANL